MRYLLAQLYRICDGFQGQGRVRQGSKAKHVPFFCFLWQTRYFTLSSEAKRSGILWLPKAGAYSGIPIYLFFLYGTFFSLFFLLLSLLHFFVLSCLPCFASTSFQEEKERAGKLSIYLDNERASVYDGRLWLGIGITLPCIICEGL